MDRNERIKRLKAMLEQVSPGGTMESMPRRAVAAESPAEGGLEGAIDTGSAVDGGLSKLTEGRERELTPSEMNGLEAIVMPRERPVVFVRGGNYDDIEAPWTHLNAAAVKARFVPVLRSVGRIEVPGAPWYPYGGTGFVVGSNLVMTNRHVARLVTQGVGTVLQYRSGDAAVDMKREAGSPEGDRTAYFLVRSVIMIHPFWDMALLRTEGLEGYAPLPLSVVKPEDMVGREVLTAGYPARDDRSDLALQDRIFQRQYNVKRVQPGKLRAREMVRSFTSTVNAMTHDSSTLGGNSGSAIIDATTGEVVGLHFAGEYLKANYAVPTHELARDARVVRAGLNFIGGVSATAEWDEVWRRAGATEGPSVAATTTSPTAQAPPPAAASAAPAPSFGGGGGAVSLTIPLHITVSLGEAGRTAGAATVTTAASAVAAPGVEIPLRIPKIYGGLEHRKGYQPGFLGLEGGEGVPLPALTALGGNVVAPLADGSSELKYHKFSVVVHKGRRMALFTASNVDWRAQSRLVNGRKPTRRELTELPANAAERWVTDWRIAPEHQLPDAFYTRDGGAFDKGHVVRRDDVCWGSGFQDIQKANGDTYHTTNCSPQTSAFNQGSREDDDINNWGDLETLVQKQTAAEKSIILAGPVFEEGDPLFEGRDDGGRTLVRIPRSFWKIVVVKGAQGPEAYGFVLEQDLSSVPVTAEEMAVPTKWLREMRSIEHIEGLLHGLATIEALKPFDKIQSQEGVQLARAVAAGGR